MATTRFNDLVTFSRGSNATVVGPNGLIQWAPNNLLLQSESFDAATWTKAGVTITANSTAAPDGTATADKIVEDTSTGAHNVFVTGINPSVYTFSGYARAAERSWLVLRIEGNDTYFNLADGTIGISAVGNLASIQNAGNGWYRCIVVRTTTVAAAATFRLATADNVSSYTGTAGSGLFLWGAQLEIGSAATTYNPTTVKNLLGFSEAFDNAAWSKVRATIVPGAQANPINGLFNGQKLMEDTSNNSHFITQSAASVVGGTSVTVSIYVKPAGRNFFAFVTADASGTFRTSYFDVANGTLGTVAAGHTAVIQSAGNGWYRCAVTQAQSASTGNFVFYPGAAAVNGSASYQGDGNSGVYIWGAQLSDSASLDPYVPTPGAAPTSVAYYGPRFDHDPVTLAPRGILIEGQRTNLLLQSQNMFDAGYTPINGTRATSTVVGPDGVTNLAQFTSTTTGGNRLQAFQNVTSGVTYTLSVVMSAGTSSFGGIVAAASASAGAIFSLLGNGSVVSTAGTSVTASIQKLSATLFRCSMTFPATATGSCLLGWGVSNGTTYESGVYPSASSGFVYGSFVQFEAGSFATSYIPTVASQVTRLADVATLNGSNFSGWYNQPEGTFVAQLDMTDGSAARASNRVALSARESATSSHNIYNGNGEVTGWTVVSGVDQAFLLTGTVAADTVTYMAYTYKTNDFAASRNGGTIVADTTGTLPSPTALGIGSNAANALYLSGHIRQIAYYPFRLSDLQLQALTELPLITSLSLDFLNGVYEG